MTMNWISALALLQADNTPSVLITVIDQHGSTPRNCGTKMVVTAERQYCTIGGGHLEFECTQLARQLLKEARPANRTERFSLGARLGQCCGGAATVLFELVITALPHIALFGAGHVGKALITILTSLPCAISWVDNRADQFPAHMDKRVRVIIDNPLDALADLPQDSYFIVMTHDHQLDFQIVEQILKRGGFQFCGLIGSLTKRRRFNYRLRERGISADALGRLRCPVGLEAVKGKLPAEIAVAIAAEMISCYNRRNAHEADCDTEGLQKRAG